MTNQLPQKSLTTPIPTNETQRLAALHRYKVLDTPPEAAFDRITTLAARLFNMPVALISLVDESRAWFKSCIGFAAREVPRDATLCSFAVLTDQPLIIPDTRLDERFACNPFVQSEPGVRFYAGAPLLSHDGFNLGTLCLLDTQPREPLSADQQTTLVDLAAMVVDELELRLAAQKIAQVDAALLEITQGVATVTGEAFFAALVQHFAQVLDADYVYIGLVEGDEPKMMRTLATCAHGQIVDNLEYPLQDTPCWEAIKQRKICCYRSNVQPYFPNAPLLKLLEVESHVAIPFFNSSGTLLGLLGVMDSKPLENVQLTESLLTLFALRISTELERQQTEVALRESEEKYRRLFESIDEGYFIADVIFDDQYRPSDLLYLEVNPAVKRITGLELAGRSLRELDPNYESYWWETFGRVAQTGIGERQELYAEPLKSWFSFYAFKVGSTNSHRVAAVFQNVTERRNMEQERERFLALGSDLQTIIGNDGYFRWVSPTFERLLGWTVAEMTARPWRDFVHPDDVPASLAEASSVFSGSETFGFENRYQHKDGSYRWFLWNAQPHLEEGALYGAAIDITQRKVAEAEREQLLQREQTAREVAENANRIKDEFLAVLSHELRSPLNPILGWTRLLKNGKLDETRQREALATIERNAKLQTQLIEDLLDISRIMQGKLSLTIAPVSLTFVITAAVETVRLAAEAKNIQILLDLTSATSPVSGDAARLQQVVWNLLTNAVKFTPNGGQVSVELRQLEGIAQIRVLDTGKGINPQFLPYVFEYFRQEDGSTTRKFGGLGLGLAIVRQIVEMHGGTVKAESKGENQGATFTVQLPIIEQAAPILSQSSQAPAENTAEPLRNLQILVVDDDADTREFQAFLLEQSGAKVIAVASGMEALQVLEQFIPDVLVSDIGMAQMDGYMLIQLLRSRPPNQGGRIPALALTAYAAEVDQQRAIQAGFEAFITKPVEPETLVKAIITLLDGNHEVEKSLYRERKIG